MTHSTSFIRFNEGNAVRELKSNILNLRKSHDRELLTTVCGKTIDLTDLLSINGISWSI